MAGNLSILNTGTPVQGTITSLTVRLRFSRALVRANPTSVGGSGWSFVSNTQVGTQQEYVFTWIGALPAFGSTPSLSFTIPLRSAGTGQVISSTASAAGPGTTTATASAVYTT